MNVLERTIAMRWRDRAYECWCEAQGDAERAEQLFRLRKPEHMKAVPWELIIRLAIELFKLWIKHPPQAVMTQGEAAFLGLEND